MINVKKEVENYLTEAKQVLRETMALALLPRREIKKGLLFVISGVPHQLEPYFASFFAYYEATWIRKIKPKRFSVYKATSRTNNYSEAAHRQLNIDIHTKLSTSAFAGKRAPSKHAKKSV